jgi:NADPH:quinone reductase-like Zn-dependent oxidoreductase
MKAYTLESYGPADRLELSESARPEPGPGEVLVRVRATSVNPYDWHHLRGTPTVMRVMPGPAGLRRPAYRVLGCDLAGQVESAGAGVTGFRPGDEVLALVTHGAYAEYACVPRELLVRKPAGLSFAQAAALPMAAVTALRALLDAGGVEPGQQVLVNGASGGVGTFAVQLARAFGGEVTGVCSGAHADLVRSIGAAEVIDYLAADFTRQGRRYDLVLDVAGRRTAVAMRRAVARDGALVLIGGPGGRWFQPLGHMIGALAVAPLLPQRVLLTDATRADWPGLLATVTGQVEAGTVTPVIDREYSFADLPAAVAYQERGHAAGKVVVTM